MNVGDLMLVNRNVICISYTRREMHVLNKIIFLLTNYLEIFINQTLMTATISRKESYNSFHSIRIMKILV